MNNNVKYLKLNEILDYIQPTKYIVKSTRYSDDYDVPVLTAGQTFILGYTNEKEGIFDASKENPAIIFDDFTTAFKWVDFKCKVKSSAAKFLVRKDKNINLKYVYYAMKSLKYKVETHSRHWISKYSELIIPVPDIEIQNKIVKLLDEYETKKNKLKILLDNEQAKVTEIFNYYRELLINHNGGEEKKLKDIAEISLGLTATPKYTEDGIKFISAQNVSSDILDLENVKYISKEDYEKASNNAKPKKGDILFERVGSNLGHPVIVDTDEELCMFVSLGFLRVKDNGIINTFLKHWMNSESFWKQVKKNVHGSAKINLNNGWLKEFIIQCPNIKKQKEICELLDLYELKRNRYITLIEQEKEKNEQQFDYYCKKILNFKEQ